MATTIEVCKCGFARTPSNTELHAECSTLPASTQSPRAATVARPPRTERIASVRMGDHQGEYLDATRHPNGLLALRHFTPGTRPADTVVLEPDEAARLAAFILRTLGHNARYSITEAGRRVLVSES